MKKKLTKVFIAKFFNTFSGMADFLSANQNDAKNVVGGSSVRELQSLFVREIVYRHVIF